MSSAIVGGSAGAGVKLEIEGEACCVCGREDEELFSPEEHDASSGAGGELRAPLRTMLLQLNNNKVVPSGRLCARCIRRAEDAYGFSQALAARGPPPLSEKIHTLRKRLAELTQKIDVFIVVGGAGAAGGYSEEDVIMVERGALQAAERGDGARAGPAALYQCTQCPATYQRICEFRAHIGGHGASAGAGGAHWCWACGAAFASPAELEAHAGSHALDPLHCHLCNSTHRTAAELRHHETAAPCPSLCPACGWLAPSRAELRTHARSHPLLCRECFQLCASAPERTAHAAAHAALQHYVCGYRACILRFTTRSNLMAHIRKCHGGDETEAPAPPAAVACPHCPRSFGSAAAMKRHLRTHQDNEHNQDAEAEADAEWQAPEAEERVEYLEVEALEDMETEHRYRC